MENNFLDNWKQQLNDNTSNNTNDNTTTHLSNLSNSSRITRLSLPSKNYKIIDNNFLYFRKYVIGTGSFGKVLYGMNVEMTQEYAVKFEKSTVKTSVIEEELKILKDLKGGIGIPNVYYSGHYHEYKIIIMDLLGPSLDKFFKISEKKLNLETTLNFGIEMIKRIEYVHSKGYLHRDIKPNNFLLGKFKRNFSEVDNTIFIVDFGLSRTYLNNLKHYEYKDSCRFVGTPRYASVNTHLGIRQSRRDDLESIIYIIIYFLKGDLPWQGVRAKTKSEKKEKIKNIKKSTSSYEICDNIPKNLIPLLDYVKQLKFEEKPDYYAMIKILNSIKSDFNLIDDISNIEWEWNSIFIKSKKFMNDDPNFYLKCKKNYDKLYEGYPVISFEEYLIVLENKKYNSIDNEEYGSIQMEDKEDNIISNERKDSIIKIQLLNKKHEKGYEY